MKRILYILLAITLLQSCNDSKSPDPKQTVYKNYIKSFIVEPDFYFGYNPLTDLFGLGSNLNKSPENYATQGDLFNQLCDYFGDNKYNRYEAILNQYNCVYADAFTFIDITCNIDFDTKHPAGTSLGDITMIHASSPYKFIKSGYKDGFDWSKKPDGFHGYLLGVNSGFHPIYKLMSEMKPEDMILLNLEIRFTFTKPRPAGKQTYTITLKTKDKTFENKVTIE